MNARMNAKIVCALMIVASFTSVNAQQRSPSWNLTTPHTFLGEADGASPGEVGLDPAGNLYGITAFGGDAGCGQSGGCGVAFKLNPSGQESIPHTFTAPPDGANSYVGLLRDSSGVFYGETLNGGSNGAGIIFKLAPPPTACASVLCPWHETILHQFSGGSGDGGGPYGDLIEDSSGNIYGATGYGGSADSGTVFELGSAGNESILYSFPGYPTDGTFPSGALLRDRAGNLYGVTTNGGTNNAGTVFELSPSGSGWTEQVLYNFTGGSDGFLPIAGLIADEQGNLYGTTNAGGDLNCGALGSCGVVFELSPNLNGTWSETVIHTFTGVPDGGAPWVGALIRDSAGNLYGTTQNGGIATGCPFGTVGCGTVFELSPNGSGGWTENILYSFMGGADGSDPIGPVTMDAHGNLYGAAFNGGDLNSNNPACTYNGTPVGCGTVFKLTP
jgi:uncharacterized repeat protein (TIGR03803 family)